MTPTDQIQMMKRCADEIKSLRSRIERLEPKAHAYDTLSNMVGLLVPEKRQGQEEDLVRMLNKSIAEEQNALIKVNPAPSAQST